MGSPPVENNVLLRMAGISKAFPGVVALDGVDFEVRAGEVHALLGENGAGKSTLVTIMTGVYEKDSGEMYVRGEKVELRSPLDAQRLGIRIIHQEFTLINDMSVAENIFLDAMGSRMLSWVPYRRMRAESRELLKRLGLHHVSVDALVRDLSVAEQQIVATARARGAGARGCVADG